jgi:hypothetical protein
MNVDETWSDHAAFGFDHVRGRNFRRQFGARAREGDAIFPNAENALADDRTCRIACQQGCSNDRRIEMRAAHATSKRMDRNLLDQAVSTLAAM